MFTNIPVRQGAITFNIPTKKRNKLDGLIGYLKEIIQALCEAPEEYSLTNKVFLGLLVSKHKKSGDDISDMYSITHSFLRGPTTYCH